MLLQQVKQEVIESRYLLCNNSFEASFGRNKKLCSRTFELQGLGGGGGWGLTSIYGLYSWFSDDVTKIQTKKLSLLPSFYFRVILEHLKTLIQTNFRFKRVLCFAIQDA